MHATVGESLHGVVGERWAVEVVVVTRPTGGLPPVRPLTPATKPTQPPAAAPGGK